MADSNITKRALAASLKNLMSERSFSKISIGDICEKCEMNRKSFYYHFRDKYDLVNWIFEREFVCVSNAKGYRSASEAFKNLCEYIFNNKEFYREALKIEGQNSFSEYFIQYCSRAFVSRLRSDLNDEELVEFQAVLLADSLKNAIERWICEKDCLPPERFCEMLKTCVRHTAVGICREFDTIK